MTVPAVLPLPSGVFADDEPVLQSSPLLPGAEIPRFGNTTSWPMRAVRRPANITPSAWDISFAGVADPIWNLRAREISMALLNPTHPAVKARVLNLRPRPAQGRSVRATIQRLRTLAAWATKQGLPSNLSLWQDDDCKAFIANRREELGPSSIHTYILLIKLLHRLSPLLTGGGLTTDPWPGTTSGKAAHLHQTMYLSTPNIPPQTWFPLVRAAWQYVHVFAPDILSARRRYQQLRRDAVSLLAGREDKLTAYLADPANIVPLHTDRVPRTSEAMETGGINWRLLSLMIGIDDNLRPFSSGKKTSVFYRMRAAVEDAVAAGRGRPGGLLAEYAIVDRPDGTSGPWHPGLCSRSVVDECFALRAAAYVFVAALSMMRDSEIREITRGAVTEFYGAPAVTSTKRKHDPDLPVEHWWIIEPVAEAIAVAEELSDHPELIFAADKAYAKTGGGFNSGTVVRTFIERVNAGTAHHGLHIPAARVTPHMFRKTMAMLTEHEPGGEIALGVQLKHVAARTLANRTTHGYGATDTQWEKLLGTAVEHGRFERLSDFYDAHHGGENIGFGPGADQLKKAFDDVKTQMEELVATGKARQGDRRVEQDLLRKARISIRFGKLNHCTVNEANPVGAKCLEGNVRIPDGHRGPLIDRCQPGRCANSITSPAHLPIWKAERASLRKLKQDKKLPAVRQALIDRQLEDVQAVIDRAEGQEQA
ncbi:hypothetical protein GCM10029978_067420 [Actinoallomurus acanthiterrae]